jgi:LAO/AO transport system kinase
MDIVEKLLSGDRRALSKLITTVENDLFQSYPIIDKLFPFTGNAKIIGVTGSPGSGKSSMVNQMVRCLRFMYPENPFPVAIIAVDPSSPFSGGALLGDRIRMRDLSGDENVFIRSMASRGILGGIASTTGAVVQILDAAGFQWIIIETVGTGQSEIEIARLADTTLLVVTASMGDDIQLNKAGILEIADIFVVNKSDQPGAESFAQAIKLMLHMSGQTTHGRHHGVMENRFMGEADRPAEVINWIPPVLSTNSIAGEGFEKIIQSIQTHHTYLRETGLWEKRDLNRLQKQLNEIIQMVLYSNWYAKISEKQYGSLLNDLLNRKISPYLAASKLLEMDLNRVEIDSTSFPFIPLL